MTGSEDYGIGFYERMMLLKYSPIGKLLWRFVNYSDRAFSSVGYAIAPALEATYVAMSDATLKVDARGQFVWTRRVPGTYVRAIIARDNRIFVAGGRYVDPYSSDVWVACYDSDGNALWSDGFNGGDFDIAHQIQFDRVGDIVVSARLNSIHDRHTLNLGVLKYTQAGLRKWARSISLSESSEIGTAAIDPENNIVMGGITGYDGYVNTTFALKLDQEGNTVWVDFRNYFADAEQVRLGNCDAIGNIYLAVSSEGGPIFALKYSPDGDLIHDTVTDIRSWYRLGAAASDQDGNIYLPATRLPYEAGSIICKVTTSGTVAWSQTLRDGASHEEPRAALGADNSVYMSTGSNFGGNWDILSAKYVQTDGRMLAFSGVDRRLQSAVVPPSGYHSGGNEPASP
ncbi:MAG: hypothetical protein ACR2HJ_10140 [Fimbriimonadales bacterium]